MKSEEEGWEAAFIRVLGCRHLSYRTEQSYLGWLKRFEIFCGGGDLRGMPDGELKIQN